jgi:5'-nucleotidase
VLGLPGIAVSQQSLERELDFRLKSQFDFDAAASFTARLVHELSGIVSPSRTLLNVNFPGCEPSGVSVVRLGRRYYTDELEVVETDPASARRHRYSVYGESAGTGELEPGTDITAIAEGRVAITPLQFDLTHHEGVESLVEHDLERLLQDRVESDG